jgi:hypothetical protein
MAVEGPGVALTQFLRKAVWSSPGWFPASRARPQGTSPGGRLPHVPLRMLTGKPRHNFVHLSADLSRPDRLIVTQRICRCRLFPSECLIVALWGVVTGSAGLA